MATQAPKVCKGCWFFYRPDRSTSASCKYYKKGKLHFMDGGLKRMDFCKVEKITVEESE